MADQNPTEEWRPVVGYEDLYLVSNLGRVMCKERVRRHRHGGFAVSPPKLMSANKGQSRYFSVGLKRSGEKQRRFRICRLVLSAFIRPPRDGEQANHKNCNTEDDRVENLEWVSSGENNDHAIESGRIPITGAETVRELLRLRAEGIPRVDICARLGISDTTFHRIIHGEHRSLDELSTPSR